MTTCSCSATAFSGVFKVRGNLKKGLKLFRVDGYSQFFIYFFFFQIFNFFISFFPPKWPDVSCLGTQSEARGRLITAQTAGLMTAWALENLKGKNVKFAVGQTQNQLSDLRFFF